MLILSAVGALLVLLLTAAGAVALTGIVPTAGLLGEKEEPTSADSANSLQPSLDSTTTTASVSPDSPPDPAFDKLLPTLVQKTRASIFLPAELPDGLDNPAIDAGFRGQGYGILFLREPPDGVEEKYVRARVLGMLQALPRSKSKSNEYFEATKVEKVELPDSTEATLRYLEPTSDQGTQGPYWEGKFVKGGTTYVLTIISDDVTEDSAKHALSTMVSVPQGDPSAKTRTTPDKRRDATRAKENPAPEERRQDEPKGKGRSSPPPRPVQQTQTRPVPQQGSDPYTYCNQNPQMCPTWSPEERVWDEKALYPWK